eukprot:9239125-Pyramimonas_sp.AAC.2
MSERYTWLRPKARVTGEPTGKDLRHWLKAMVASLDVERSSLLLPRERSARVSSTSSQGFNDSGEEILCKICYEGQEDEDGPKELVRPCACRGSAAYIHIACLKQWHLSLGNPTTLRCPTCKQAYVGNVAVQVSASSIEFSVQLGCNNREDTKGSRLRVVPLLKTANLSDPNSP